MDSEQTKLTLKTLRTCRGQIEGILAMIEDQRAPLDVFNQILAAQALLKRAGKQVLATHLKTSMEKAMGDGSSPREEIRAIEPILEKLLT